MAKFLKTTGVSHHLEEIIDKARDKVVIISPYLKINDRLKGILEDKDRMKINIHVVYGKNELQPSESAWLQDLNSIRTTFLKNLHAKCYLNEDNALITSMNLYEFSQQNNEEMGILVSREQEPELYREIDEAAKILIRKGEEVKLIAETVIPSAETPAVAKAKSATPRAPKRSSSRKTKTTTPILERPSSGHCIRCGGPMSEAIESRPFCEKDWRTWNRFKKDAFTEKFCHFCGQPYETSKSKPLCLNCFRKYNSILEL